MYFILQVFLAKFCKSMSVGFFHSIGASIVAISLLAATNCFSADLWVSQPGSGSQSGADTNACLPIASVNSSWPASAGDTVHLCGTFTSGLTIGGGGSGGSYVIVHFEPNSMFIGPTFPSGPWINCNQSYVVIDGGQNGLIENTNNGTVVANGGTMGYGYDGAGINFGYSANFVTVKNLAIRDMYQRQTNTEPIQSSGDGNDIYFAGHPSGVLLSNCWFGEAMNGVGMSYGSAWSSNVTVIGCTFTNYNHGFTLGAGAVTTPVFNNLVIRSNVFQGGDMFETGAGVGDLGLHRNPIFMFNESSDRNGCISNVEISYNFICHGWHPLTSTAGTGAMFFDFYNSYMAANVRVFNNISTLVYPLTWSGGGGFISGTGNGVLVANNTAVMWNDGGSYGYGPGSISIAGTNCQSFNNILISRKGATAATWADTSGFGSSTTNYAAIGQSISGLQFDHNIYNGQSGYSEYNAVVFNWNTSSTWYNGQPDSFTDWKGWYGFDAHSTTATVSLQSNFAPSPGDTVAIGNGTNLTAFGISNDFYSVARPSTGNWTIGAVGTTNGAPQASAPLVWLVASPTNITVGIPNVVQSSTLTWSSVNATNVTLNGFGPVPLNGSTNVSPSQTTTYTAIATSSNGANSASVSVYAGPATPGKPQITPQ